MRVLDGHHDPQDRYGGHPRGETGGDIPLAVGGQEPDRDDGYDDEDPHVRHRRRDR